MTTTSSALSHLECSRTGIRYDADVVQGVSDAGVPLLARYDIERAGRTLTREALAGRPATLWCYHEMLPVRDPGRLVAEQLRVARDEGTFLCPETAACLAAARQLRETGFIGAADSVVVLNTGTGLKYPETITVDVPTPAVDGVIPPR
jgi:threonine synthase